MGRPLDYWVAALKEVLVCVCKQVAVITGAGSGTGLAMASLFAKEGAKIIAGDWNAARLDAAVFCATMQGCMNEQDDQNLILASSTDFVEQRLAEFYAQFPYPWRPAQFDYLLDPHFEVAMLNQDIGDWKHQTIPTQPKIWVAGCGTNQALITALRFPNGTVVGSDVSRKSLEICAALAHQLHVTNLTLQEESINHAAWQGEFDYVICTGVIHHNADPQEPLQKLAAALKPAGILELMVYNRYHRMTTSAFQKAIRLLSSCSAGFQSELAVAKKLVHKFPLQNLIAAMLETLRDAPEAMLTDGLLQPVEHSFTVESLHALAEQCGLAFILPCANEFDKISKTLDWNMAFYDPELQAMYDSLPDLQRWQISNLLQFDKSPMLWFYLHRQENGGASEKQTRDALLETRFAKARTSQKRIVLQANGKYGLLPDAIRYPIGAPELPVRKLYDAVEPSLPLGAVLERLGIQPTAQTVGQIRLKLTTRAFPYLRAVQPKAA